MMTENFKNKIHRLELENFTCFSKATFDFSSGINVFIGENGTGKTHILKVLYGIFNDKTDNSNRVKNASRNPYWDDLPSIFKVDSRKFSRRNSSNSNVLIKVSAAIGPNRRFWHYEYDQGSGTATASDDATIHSLFIPSQEILSLHQGFIANYLKRESNFDRTYFDMAVELDSQKLKGKELTLAQTLLSDFDEIRLGVTKKDNNFFITEGKEEVEIEAQLSAEGLKKIAQMIYLIQNGSLTKDTILFWDEPEVNLNPRYIKIVAKFLQTLAKNGVQIFVATHDYLLVHLLSLDAEYQQVTDAPPMKFFALTKGENGTEVESADTIAGITNNALLDEYSAYSELEHQLFKQSMQMV